MDMDSDMDTCFNCYVETFRLVPYSDMDDDEYEIENVNTEGTMWGENEIVNAEGIRNENRNDGGTRDENEIGNREGTNNG